MDKKRLIIGVICTEADNIEQKQLISGITETALGLNNDIAVISNIYNPDDAESELFCENEIYDLILSKDLDGIILIAESFMNSELKKRIINLLTQRPDIPVIAIGTETTEYLNHNFTFINTDDEQDITDITNHLIEEHGFTDIDILTGLDFLDVSAQRVNGYRKALEAHGIPFDEKKVHYGNFWLNSGQELAQKYLSGAVHKPQALVCANDYMAYGFLDEMCENDICIPDYITVIGYEDAQKRMKHSPVLTTYRRNRKQLGTEAVRLIYSKIRNKSSHHFTVPHGEIIYGDTCSCGRNIKQYNAELKEIRELEVFEHLNLLCQQEEKLSGCSNLNEFVSICSGYCYLLRNAAQFTYCLSENWYDSNAEKMSDIMVCHTVNFYSPEPNFNRLNISAVIGRNSSPAVYYFSPVFFSSCIFGYQIVRYDMPHALDYIYRRWLKCIANSLEFLRMKNDIKYLSQCQNLSESNDSMTGLLSENGLIKNLELKLKSCERDDKLVMIMVKTGVVSKNFSTEQQNVKNRVDSEAEAGECLKLIAKSENEYCARIGDNTFVYAGVGKFTPDSCFSIEDKIIALISHSSAYQAIYGAHSFASASLYEDNPSDCSINDKLSVLKADIKKRIDEHSSKQILAKYSSFINLRNEIYAFPNKEYSDDKLCRKFEFSQGYFRTLYKNYFGISLHQDIILAKISLAKNLLLTTNMTIQSIAFSCGYDDEKYFMYQFRKCVGITASKYRI